MYNKNEPLFAFGHGLSYTTFEYENLKVAKNNMKDGDIIDISLDVKNTGTVNSEEVVQLYVSYPESKVERPIKELKGFKRVHIAAGESMTVTIPIKADDLRYWNEDQHAFELEKGKIPASTWRLFNGYQVKWISGSKMSLIEDRYFNIFQFFKF
jgi:beta-glucosidase